MDSVVQYNVNTTRENILAMGQDLGLDQYGLITVILNYPLATRTLRQTRKAYLVPSRSNSFLTVIIKLSIISICGQPEREETNL